MLCKKQLHFFHIQNAARAQNHKAVEEEKTRENLPKNWESRKRQADWIIQDEAARKEAEEKVNQRKKLPM